MGRWNSLREFVYSDDVAFVFNEILQSSKIFAKPVNVGTGEEISILKFGEHIKSITKFNGNIAR